MAHVTLIVTPTIVLVSVMFLLMTVLAIIGQVLYIGEYSAGSTVVDYSLWSFTICSGADCTVISVTFIQSKISNCAIDAVLNQFRAVEAVALLATFVSGFSYFLFLVLTVAQQHITVSAYCAVGISCASVGLLFHFVTFGLMITLKNYDCFSPFDPSPSTKQT